MSEAKHTPGRLRVSSGWLITADDHIPIAEESTHHTRAENDANMRRLAACWNACKHVSTDLLEEFPAPFSELRARHDQMLKALQGLLAVVNVRIDDPRTEQFDAARAAIAKATGGAA